MKALHKIVLLVALVVPVWFAVPGSVAHAQTGVTISPQGEYTPVTPSRILDTRDGNGRGAPNSPLRAGESYDVQVLGRGGVPASGVSAVVLNLTGTEPTSVTFVSLWPAGTSRPTVSNLNLGPGETIANLVTVKIGTQGAVSLFNNAGTTHVILDVEGYYADAAGTSGTRFHSISPHRVLDTRIGAGGIQGPLGPGATIGVLTLPGTPSNLPAGARAVAFNVTVTEPTSFGYVTVYPSDVSRPVASNVNFSPGQSVPNLVIVRVGTNGFVNFFNSGGQTQVVIDIVGYYDTQRLGDGGRYVPLAPNRIMDTRTTGTPVLPGEVRGLAVAGAGGLPSVGLGAVVMNVTVTGPTAPAYLAVYPAGGPPPGTSTLNYLAGQTIANLAIVGPVDVWVAFQNSAGVVHVIADVAGYFRSPATLAFDTCEAPTVAQMAAWRSASPYSAIGIYIGADSNRPPYFGNRACRNLALDNPTWLNAVVGQGWKVIPTYVGLQAPCTGFNMRMAPDQAAAQGAASAEHAISVAQAAGIGPGAPIYFDLEAYANTDASCVHAVQEFIGAWTTRLHQLGYKSGLYGSLLSGIMDEYRAYQLGYPPVDALWIAAWNDTQNIYGFPGLPDTVWSGHQRMHQYSGGHNETYGGVTLNIDANVVDGPLYPG